MASGNLLFTYLWWIASRILHSAFRFLSYPSSYLVYCFCMCLQITFCLSRFIDCNRCNRKQQDSSFFLVCFVFFSFGLEKQVKICDNYVCKWVFLYRAIKWAHTAKQFHTQNKKETKNKMVSNETYNLLDAHFYSRPNEQNNTTKSIQRILRSGKVRLLVNVMNTE